ncbi:Uncharacterised protein [Vibrio cholerae]|uniref:Uncharacterized protein n=1 Tax=Vibrio cholerae TaxID=666 RepID=A0A656ADK7_VIBCL|nr:Uncharacterised protein [Vibrio cholerae]CSI49250.1 Uncharacterised protein [Vibrio cholerae]
MLRTVHNIMSVLGRGMTNAEKYCFWLGPGTLSKQGNWVGSISYSNSLAQPCSIACWMTSVNQAACAAGNTSYWFKPTR